MKANKKLLELLVLGVSLGCLSYFLKPLLVGKTILAHDNFYWNFPIFHYTAVTLINGSLPLWDPFSNGGQPFYPHLVQFRLLEPVILLTIGIGQFFTKNTVILFNLSKILQTLVLCLGAYLCLTRYATSRVTRIFLIPLLLFSSFFLGSFHQDGILSQFVWVPWLLHFLLAILFDKDIRWYRFLFVSVFVGLNWQSYQFAGTWTFLLFFTLAVALFHRVTFKELWKSPGVKLKTSISLLLVMGMMGPNIALIQESSRFTFPLRMAPKEYKEILMQETGLLPTEAGPNDVKIGIKMPYEMIPYTGAMVKVWEVLQTLSPNANSNIHSLRNPNTWGFPSEAFIYMGLFPWALALLGLVFGKSNHKKLWILITIGFGLLMMGPPGGLHRILFHTFPPLWFIRHTTLFVLFFVFGMLYFFILGMEFLLEKKFKLEITPSQWATLLPFAIVLFTFGVLATKLDYPVFKFPETNFLFVIFVVLALATWKILPNLGASGLWVSLLATQIALLLFLTPTFYQSLFYLLAFLGVPLLLLFLHSKDKKKANFLWACIFLTTFSDLLFSFWSAGRLYAWQESPDSLFEAPMKPLPVSTEPREVFPEYPTVFYGRQAPRYLSLFHQKRFAMNGLLHFRQSEGFSYPQDMAFALEGKRWNSYLLLDSYFKLIHSGLSPTVLTRVFQIREPLFQFRANAFPEAAFYSLSKTQDVSRLMENAVIIGAESSFPTTDSKVSQAEVETLKASYNSWKGKVSAGSNGYFLYGDTHDRYWTVTVDGKKVPLLRLNLRSKGVYLNAGTHVVEFEYKPNLFLISVFVFLLIPALIVSFYTLYWFAKCLRNPQKVLIPAFS